MIEEGGVDVAAPLRKDSQVAFEWRARGEGFDETSQVTLRCNSAVDRGVPLPASWKTSLRCLSLPDLAEKSAHVAREGGVREARCVVLGQPKPSPLPEPGAALQPGAVVLFGQRIEHLLCAHVEGDLWLCHFGSFDYTALCQKDLVRDAPEEGPSMPRKRLRPRLRPGQLRELALSRSQDWDRLVAVATWKAEELRAGPFDEVLALGELSRGSDEPSGVCRPLGVE